MVKYPPLIEQFIENQKRYPDAIVATEVGGFFEIWELPDRSVGHAIRVSNLLDLILTKRNKSDVNSPFMVGFPSHSAQGYFQKLVELGETVVLVEQTIRGRKTDGNKNVTRQISKILSPGTTLNSLPENKNNYFASVYLEDNQIGLTLIDISTGEVEVAEFSKEIDLQDFIDKIHPKEILITGKKTLNFKEQQLVHENSVANTIKKIIDAGRLLIKIYDIKNPTSDASYGITSLGLNMHRSGALALANLVNYLSATEYNQKLLKKIAYPKIRNVNNSLQIPLNSLLALEIIESKNDPLGNNTLLNSIDECYTSMGKRLLKNWLLNPSTDLKQILERQNKVESYIKNNVDYNELKEVYDFARISRRMVIGNLLPHEIGYLFQSLEIVSLILKQEKNKELSKKAQEIAKFLEKNIDIQKAMIESNSGSFEFFQGDLLNKVSLSYSDWKQSSYLMNEEIVRIKKVLEIDKLRLVEKLESFHLLGPKSLSKNSKIKVEQKANDSQIIEKSWVDISKDCFSKKQVYLFHAQKEWEEFQLLFVNTYGQDLIKVAEVISSIDVLNNFARISKNRGYTKPTFKNSEKAMIDFKNVRHPVVEISKKLTEGFVPNSLNLGIDFSNLVVYGANSSGKSTILKSVALNIFLAQIGCYVACDDSSSLSIFEGIFTRITTHDSLSEGLSTFTMEMTELQNALKNKNKKCLFLFDEIGRGTSVEDGEALAYGTLNYLDDPSTNSITLFATHYHNLYNSIKDNKNIKVSHLKCYTNDEGILVFVRKVIDGPGEGSYGIEVAKSCGVPIEIIRMATRYTEKYGQLKKSRYNKNVSGIICPICEINPVQETHHMVEQHQGKVKTFKVDGAIKNINTQENLLMICSSCHEKITRGEISVVKVKTLGEEISIEVQKKK